MNVALSSGAYALRESSSQKSPMAMIDSFFSQHSCSWADVSTFPDDLPSLEHILQVMLGSMDDYEILEARMTDPE